MTTKIDYLISTNEDWLDSIQLLDGDDPVDLTGSTFHAQVRSAADSSIVFLDASTANGLLFKVDSFVAWNVPKATIAARLPPAEYVFDKIWVNTAGHFDRVTYGTITVKIGITRP